MTDETSQASTPANGSALPLRRDLGRLESYATLIGILIGAGIFRVTSDAWTLTGSSVILGYLVLAPAVLATSIPYAVYLSTPLGRLPGGEYTHIAHTWNSDRIAFLGVWLKIISYLGALAFLANAFADYVLATGVFEPTTSVRMVLSLGSLLVFFGLHVWGIRWFGRMQVFMFLILAVSIVVLIVPGLLAIKTANYTPVFSGGTSGFMASLPLLFFAYAGFEALGQAAGEVRDSTQNLPRIFLRGILATTLIFIAMSVVTFGVLPGAELARSRAPMTAVANVYLPPSLSWIITLGAVMAIATSLNATMLVPSRLLFMLSRDGLAPAWLGAVHPRTATPVRGLILTLLIATALVLSQQVSLALNIAVLALIILYFVHSFSLLALPHRNPALYAAAHTHLPLTLQRISGVISMFAMALMITVIVRGDLSTIRELSLRERTMTGQLTSFELLVTWSVIGFVVYTSTRRWRRTLSRRV